MNLGELITSVYSWADLHALYILSAALIFPAAGTLLAGIGKTGKSDRDGRVVASLVVGGAILFMVAELASIAIAHMVLGKSVMDANVLLLVAPAGCLALSLIGMRLVFPLGELASVKTFIDIGLFVLACSVAIWLLSKFRGWGILFFGGVAQLATIGIFTWALLKRLYRRAFGSGMDPSSSEERDRS